MALRQRVWIGIDVDKTSHHVCAVDENGKVCPSQKVGNDQQSIEAAVERIRAAGAEAVQIVPRRLHGLAQPCIN
ncbi:transposase [Nocardia sp. NPDC051463]|uniref:IS110 family transposase n=1 Tax=Nocardia sp. NPDC051463 TaxID=3154845 RepID=UPI0034505CB1